MSASGAGSDLPVSHLTTTMGQYFSRPPPLPSPQGSDQPGPNASVILLPPEILDVILGHVKVDRSMPRTLVACPLVASWWTGPSQRRIFSSVSIDEGNYRKWMNGVVRSGSKSRLLGYTRSLQYHRGPGFGVRYHMRDFPQDSGEYLPALHNLHSLELSRITVEHISEVGFPACFSAFRGTLACLSLNIFRTSFSAFVTLVDYFPNLRSLRLCSLLLEPDKGPVPPLSRPLRGKVHFRDIPARGVEFFDRFAKLDLEYEELIIDSTLSMKTRVVESALQTSPSTVKFLRVTPEIPCV